MITMAMVYSTGVDQKGRGGQRQFSSKKGGGGGGGWIPLSLGSSPVDVMHSRRR